jgi:hypothetical protein
MKTIRMQVSATVTAIAVVCLLSLSAQAQSASKTLYKGKCAACHGADGTGSAMGTKMGAHDFTNCRCTGNVGCGTHGHHHEWQEQNAQVWNVFEAGGH